MFVPFVLLCPCSLSLSFWYDVFSFRQDSLSFWQDSLSFSRILCPFVRILRPLTGFSVLWAGVFVLWARFFVLLAQSFVLFYIGSYSRGRLAPPEFRRGGLRPASPGAGSQDAAVLCVSRRGRLDLSEPRQEWLRDRGASCWSVQLR